MVQSWLESDGCWWPISPTAVLRNRSLHHREIAKEMIQKAETAGCKVSDPRRAGLLRDHPRAARLCSI